MDSSTLLPLALGAVVLALVLYLILRPRAGTGRPPKSTHSATQPSDEIADASAALPISPTPAQPAPSADTSATPIPTPIGQTRIDSADAESLLNLSQKLIRRDGSVDAKALRTFLSDHFSLEEMAQLCADLNIDFESIPGDTKDGKALELVQYCTRHGSLTELAAVAIEARA